VGEDEFARGVDGPCMLRKGSSSKLGDCGEASPDDSNLCSNPGGGIIGPVVDVGDMSTRLPSLE
jgi:hypothetical protein